MDKFLPEIVKALGFWTYLALFLVIFMETGFVVTPFLPGDSLLFAAGAIAAIMSRVEYHPPVYPHGRRGCAG